MKPRRRKAQFVSAGLMYLVAPLVLAACGTSSSPAQQVRVVARRYLHAVAVGDGRTACAMLSGRGLADGDYSSRGACARDYSSRPLKREFPVRGNRRCSGAGDR